jgi:hypothetical protein
MRAVAVQAACFGDPSLRTLVPRTRRRAPLHTPRSATTPFALQVVDAWGSGHHCWLQDAVAILQAAAGHDLAARSATSTHPYTALVLGQMPVLGSALGASTQPASRVPALSRVSALSQELLSMQACNWPGGVDALLARAQALQPRRSVQVNESEVLLVQGGVGMATCVASSRGHQWVRSVAILQHRFANRTMHGCRRPNHPSLCPCGALGHITGAAAAAERVGQAAGASGAGPTQVGGRAGCVGGCVPWAWLAGSSKVVWLDQSAETGHVFSRAVSRHPACAAWLPQGACQSR